jgi:hypothetical protein
VPSLRQLRLLGIRTGANRKGLSWPIAARWALRRQQVLHAWLAADCNGAEAARRLGVSKQCVYRTLRRHLDGLQLAAEARVEEEERLALRRGRQAHNARCRRAKAAHVKTLGADPDVSRLSPEKAPPRPGGGGVDLRYFF